jgi:putative redox protein
MDFHMTFPGGRRVDVAVDGYTIPTDQPPEASAPSPFTLFLASIGACAGYYALEFCQARGIATNGLRVTQRSAKGIGGLVGDIELALELPEAFPAKYRSAILRAVDQCTVKRHLEHPPAIHTTLSGGMAAPLPEHAGAA